MKKVYICSPYRADAKEQLDRNISYARELTRQALEAGLAPITPHLYMPQCLDEGRAEERAAGLAAGLALLESCSFVIAGIRHGISEGMSAEIAAAGAAGIEVVNADKLGYKMADERKKQAEEYARLHTCDFCQGSRLHTCSGYRCQEPYRAAYEYAEKNIAGR